MRGLYSVIWILILDSDYGYKPPKSISPVVMGQGHGPGLSVCFYSLSVCYEACLLGGLGLVILPIRLIVQETSPPLCLVCVVITSCQELYRLVGGFLTDSAFSHLFLYVPMTFTTNHPVVGSV